MCVLGYLKADINNQPQVELPVQQNQQVQTVTQPVQQLQPTAAPQIVQTQPRRVIKRTTGIQVRPPTPNSTDPDAPEVKPFTCTVCGKHYRKNANLRIHMRTHTGKQLTESIKYTCF